MKKILVICIILMIMVAPAIGGEDKEEVSYEVTINVTWNAVSSEKAVELVAQILKKHEDACSVKVTVKKNGNGGSIADDSELYIASPQDSIWEVNQ